MRLSTRLLSNAATTYVRLATTLAIGLFTTWYILGAIGVIGFGLVALAFSATGPSIALERSLRFGLVRELAAAIATGEPLAMRRSLTCAFRLCLQATAPLAALTLALAAAAAAGVFNVPEHLELALAALILAEGIHAAARLLSGPHLQALFAAQRVGLDNLLMVLSRIAYALSAVVVFGWLLPDATLARQLIGFALSRVTLQLADVGLGIWLAKSRLPGLRLDRSAYDEAEYRAVRSTVWQTTQVTVLLNLNPQFLAILINIFFGLAYNGIWQIANQFSAFARMAGEGLVRGLGPMATHLEQDGRLRAALDLLGRSIRYQLAVALPAALLLGIYARPMLELWVGRRLALDPHLAAAEVPVGAALALASAMAMILVAVRALRAGFFGVERVLYGLGKVKSYAWASKWATVLCVGSGAAMMAWTGHPLAAAVAMLVSNTFFSPVVVMLAARRATRLPMGVILGRSLPRPLIANLVFGAALALARPFLDRLTPLTLAALLAGSALVYGLLALLVVLEPGERVRLIEMLRQGAGWLAGRLRSAARRPGSTGGC